MITPRPYLSFSSMTLFERSPEEWANQYLYSVKNHESKNMAYGSMLAKGMEDDEATGDPLLDLVMARLPKFKLMDKPLEAELKNGKEIIHILAKPDTATVDYSKFKEYKTSVRKWTQRMVDESGQIDFYATAIWLKTGKIPQDIELICAETAYGQDGTLSVIGEIWRFPTKRTMIDMIKTTARMRAAWSGIKALCEKELL